MYFPKDFQSISFPVGKNNRMQMYPMSFKEFMIACREEKYVEIFNEWQIDREIPELYAKPLEKLYFSKHAPVSEIEKIRLIWDSVPKQLAKENNKFVFSHVKEGKRAHELEASLQWLKNSGLIH